MKPIVAISVLAGAGLCMGLGMFIERRLSHGRETRTGATGAHVAETPAPSGNAKAETKEQRRYAGDRFARDSPAVKALLEGLDAAQPIAQWQSKRCGGRPIGWRDRRSDPATAFMWASTVVDSECSGLVETALASWSKIDPAAARKAIDSTDWPAKEKTRWLDEVR
jgi:hypothetical protein